MMVNEVKEKGENSKQISPEYFPSVDLAKFILSIFVVAIHTNALSFLPSAVDYMLQKLLLAIAVPYFLVASGFFFGIKLKKSENKCQVLKAYCIRLAKPLLVLESVCIILTVVTDLARGNSVDVLAILHRVICYPVGALWYLQAVILSLLIIYPFAKNNQFFVPVILGLCMYLLGLLCNGYNFVVQGSSLQTIIDLVVSLFYRHNIFVALIYVAIGVKLANTDFTRKPWQLWLIIPVYAAYMLEIVLGHKTMDGGNYYLMQLFLIPLLFCLTLRIDIGLRPQLNKALRTYSTGIYLTHKAVVLPLVMLVIPSNGILQFGAVLVCSVALCTVVYRLKREPLYSLLQ